jgi:hypothetical protein
VISVDWFSHRGKRKFYDLLTFTCKNLPLAHIQILDIGPAHHLSWYEIPALFGVLKAFEGVHTLHASGSSTDLLFAKLADGHSIAEHRHEILPELSTIALLFVDFGDGGLEWTPRHWGHMDGLRSYVAWRKEENVAIARLEIRRSTGITEKKCRLIEAIVPDVWWDGDLGTELDGEDEEGDSEDVDEDEDEDED